VRLPPDPILLAARRWLEILPGSGTIRRAQALLTTHPSYGDLTPAQYATALTWLRDLGLLANTGSRAPAANQVLGAIFEKAAPAWVRDADRLVQSPDELPSDIVSAGAVLGLDAESVFGQLVSSWGKVDTEARERVGAAGEAALVALLRERTDSRVDHVSTWSDGFGYDIDFSLDLRSAHLEVKSTTRRGRFTAYLSRNEFNVMLRDDQWSLVTVRMSADLDVDGIGSVPREWITSNAPRDVSASSGWASCKLEVPAEIIEDGIPALGTGVSGLLPPWRGPAAS
jgi:hypothetical protein